MDDHSPENSDISLAPPQSGEEGVEQSPEKEPKATSTTVNPPSHEKDTSSVVPIDQGLVKRRLADIRQRIASRFSSNRENGVSVTEVSEEMVSSGEREGDERPPMLDTVSPVAALEPEENPVENVAPEVVALRASTLENMLKDQGDLEEALRKTQEVRQGDFAISKRLQQLRTAVADARQGKWKSTALLIDQTAREALYSGRVSEDDPAIREGLDKLRMFDGDVARKLEQDIKYGKVRRKDPLEYLRYADREDENSPQVTQVKEDTVQTPSRPASHRRRKRFGLDEPAYLKRRSSSSFTDIFPWLF